MSHPSLQQLATRVEKRLSALGVTLTMGGEPTYVPHEPRGAEWNLEAMGPEKLGYAHQTAANLLDTECPGAVVLQVFGKWYPGEPLPRWNVVLLDNPGDVLWPDRKSLLLKDRKGRNGKGNATRFAKDIAARLELADCLLPARDPNRSSSSPRGWVLPLDREDSDWKSDHWPWSQKQPIPLFPGDSPIGLRLPLGDLPKGALRRALTIECTNGALRLFLPPLDWSGFRELIAIISETGPSASPPPTMTCRNKAVLVTTPKG